MADVMETLKGILGDDAEEKISSAVNTFTTSGAGDVTDYVPEIKELVEKMGTSRSDPRTNLLMSLRPYLRENRRRSIDSAVKLLNLSKLSVLLKDSN